MSTIKEDSKPELGKQLNALYASLVQLTLNIQSTAETLSLMQAEQESKKALYKVLYFMYNGMESDPVLDFIDTVPDVRIGDTPPVQNAVRGVEEV